MARKPMKKQNKKKECCEICGTTKGVVLDIDAYSVEICGDTTPRYLCGDCRSMRAEEV